jgi:hypothetical protein
MRVRVAFRVGDRRLFARLIHWWDKTDNSHCEVSANWLANGAHRCMSASMLDDGVRAKTLTLTPDKWRVYEVPAEPAVALDWFEQHEGDRYDLLGLFGFVIRPIKGWLRAWFCSEACAAMLGLPEAWRYTPRSLELHCIAVGRRVELHWPEHLTE